MNEIVKFKDTQVTKTKLEIQPGASFEEWQSIGKQLQEMHGSMGWWIGDWLNYGEREYGEMYVQAVEATGNAVQTLKDYKWVASQIETSLRNDNLSFTAHRYIAVAPEEVRADLIQKAVEESMTSREVKEMVGGKSPVEVKPEPVGELIDVLLDKILASKRDYVSFERRGYKLIMKLIKEKTVSENGNLINQLIELFAPVNPSFEDFFKQKIQRDALEWLLEKSNEEFCRYVIGELSGIAKSGDRYAPVITTPVQLKNKLAELRIYLNKKEGTKNGRTLDLSQL